MQAADPLLAALPPELEVARVRRDGGEVRATVKHMVEKSPKDVEVVLCPDGLRLRLGQQRISRKPARQYFLAAPPHLDVDVDREVRLVPTSPSSRAPPALPPLPPLRRAG